MESPTSADFSSMHKTPERARDAFSTNDYKSVWHHVLTIGIAVGWLSPTACRAIVNDYFLILNLMCSFMIVKVLKSDVTDKLFCLLLKICFPSNFQESSKLPPPTVDLSVTIVINLS